MLKMVGPALPQSRPLAWRAGETSGGETIFCLPAAAAGPDGDDGRANAARCPVTATVSQISPSDGQ
ncbi:MAG: hypothetical protein FD124_2747 [Alphaproteobacteria bacterium]|nr:MAG: hypothetical protein FD160_3245 [Caulobacteraceae bacterium]TPW04128.1 MAG: hypothetical protein FD124_2747 [Alphaproteobacteria bacterium]